MDRCFLERLFLIWTLMIRLGGFCFEITVRHSELKPCEGNDWLCVTDPRDCKPPPPSPSQKMLNMSCSYQQAADGLRSVSCSWSQEAESRASLVFTSGSKVSSCLGIFNPAAILGSVRVTARIRSYLTGTEEWAQPQFLKDAVKTSWTDLGTTVRTLDRVPSRPAEMCYRVEETGDDEFLLLHLIWMGSDPGRVLGYQVRIDPNQHVQNVTDTTFLLVVKEGNYSATVRAFNTAGFGPATRLQIDTRDQNSRLSVRNLWISSHYPEIEALQVRWAMATAPPGGHVVVHWRSEENPSNSRWVRVNGSSSSAVITGVDPDEPYLVSVFPVYNQQCGPAQSLAGSLENGALMEVVSLKVVNVTKTTVTVAWAWQRKPAPIRVDRYRVMLRRDGDTQTLSLWPDQQQHTFSKLTPSTEYSLLLLADDVSRFIIPVATQSDEVPAVATVTFLLLLVVTVMIVSVLSRTLYKSYFFPTIPNARRSTAGQWLLNPDLKKCAERNFLDVADFQVTDVLGQKHLILVCPNHPQKDKSLPPTSSLSVKLDTVDIPGTRPITGHAWDVRPITEQQLLSLQSGFRAEMGGAKVPRLQEQEESDCCPQSEEDVYPHHHHQDQAFMFRFPELLSDFLEQPEPVTGPLDPVPEVEYLTNGCFRAEPASGSEPSVLH